MKLKIKVNQVQIIRTLTVQITVILIYEHFGARIMYLGHVWIITSHSTVWDVLSYPIPSYLFLAPKSPYEAIYVSVTHKTMFSVVIIETGRADSWYGCSPNCYFDILWILVVIPCQNTVYIYIYIYIYSFLLTIKTHHTICCIIGCAHSFP